MLRGAAKIFPLTNLGFCPNRLYFFMSKSQFFGFELGLRYIGVQNNIRDVGSTADLVLVLLVHLVHWSTDLVLVLLVHLVHWYLVHLNPLLPDST